jgi:hypothetical protein
VNITLLVSLLRIRDDVRQANDKERSGGFIPPSGVELIRYMAG